MSKTQTTTALKRTLIGGLFTAVAALALMTTSTLMPAGKAHAEGKTMTYALTGLYPPFSYRDGAKLTGFDVDIGRALAQQMGMKGKPVAQPWQTLIAALKANRFDAIIGSMAITPARQKAVNFSDPYYKSGAQVFVSANNNSIKSVDDLRGKTIGVLVSSTFEKTAKKYTSHIKTYTDDVTALHDLTVPGRLDAVITDQLVGENAIMKAHLPVKRMGNPLSLDNIGIAVNKNNPELLKKINKALAAIKANGKYAEVSKRYFGRDISK